jgi:hypothetical protein
LVEAQESAEARSSHDATVGVGRRGTRLDEGVVEALMVSFEMIVRGVLGEDVSEVSLAEGDHAAQALGLDGEDESLCERVQVRTSRGEQQRLHAGFLQQASEGFRIERISIEDEVALRAQKSIGGIVLPLKLVDGEALGLCGGLAHSVRAGA